MRFSLCYRIVRLKGFFWGRRLFLYRRRFSGFLSPTGGGLQLRNHLWQLGEGFFATRGFRPSTHKVFLSARLSGAGYTQLKLTSPQLELFWPSAWAVLRYLYTRHYRGRRYRLGLPARGQRTHSNAVTTNRVAGVIASTLREKFWTGRLWTARKGAPTPSPQASVANTKHVDAWR